MSVADLMTLDAVDRASLLKESFRINHITYLADPAIDVLNKSVTIYTNLTTSSTIQLPGIAGPVNTVPVTDYIKEVFMLGQGKDVYISPIFIADIDVFTQFNLGADSYLNYSGQLQSTYKSAGNVYSSVISSLQAIGAETPVYILEADGTYSQVIGPNLDSKLQSAYGRLSKDKGILINDYDTQKFSEHSINLLKGRDHTLYLKSMAKLVGKYSF